MTELDKHHEIVDKYLNDEMSQQEISVFEKEIDNNPKLFQQLKLQKENVNGIISHRKNSLKQRLNNIDITYTPLSFFASKSGKLITTVGGTIVIATAIYFGFKDTKTSKDVEKITSKESYTANDNKPISAKKTITDQETTSKENITKLNTENYTGNKNNNTKLKTIIASSRENNDITVKDSLGQDIIIANRNKANPPPSFDDMQHPANSVETTQIDRNIKKSYDSKNNKTSIDILDDVSVIKDSEYKFHYKFIGKKLILLGNFSTLYKIFDIRTKSNDREYYLKYKNKYYNLDTSRNTPTFLKKVSGNTQIIIEENLKK